MYAYASAVYDRLLNQGRDDSIRILVAALWNVLPVIPQETEYARRQL